MLQKRPPVHPVLENLYFYSVFLVICAHLGYLFLHRTHTHAHTLVAENNAKGATCSLGIMFECMMEEVIKPATITSMKHPLSHLDPTWTVNAYAPLLLQAYFSRDEHS